MTTTHFQSPAPMTRGAGWFTRAEEWLDDKGKGAWIAVMVVGFIAFWPVGLAILGYMIWSKRMFGKSSAGSARSRHFPIRSAMRSSGNTAFDAYKTETLRRLEEEQHSFEKFLERLRDAKDKAEFDQFMNDRSRTSGKADDVANDDGDENGGDQNGGDHGKRNAPEAA